METNILNKKGSIIDFFYIMAVLFLVGVILFATFIVSDKVSEADVFKDNADANQAINISKNTILSFDNLMLFIIIALSLFVIISSAMVFNHPAFFIIGIILLMIAIMVSAVVSNTFWTFTQQPQIMATAAHFPKVKFLMDKFPFYILFMGFASIIAMFIGRNQ